MIERGNEQGSSCAALAGAARTLPPPSRRPDRLKRLLDGEAARRLARVGRCALPPPFELIRRRSERFRVRNHLAYEKGEKTIEPEGIRGTHQHSFPKQARPVFSVELDDARPFGDVGLMPASSAKWRVEPVVDSVVSGEEVADIVQALLFASL